MSSQDACSLATPPKPSPGDRIAIVSPSGGLPGVFPQPFELGLDRLRTQFGLEPVEYPGTRTPGASAQQRADDLHAAFADPSVTAVMAGIGGDDQITVLPLLDRELLRTHPKPFFGYSDNTNLLAFLWNTGIVGYHGACVMVQLGRPGAMAPLTAESLHAALFTTGAYDLRPAERWTDVERPWEDPGTFASEPALEPGGGWIWHRPEHVVEGRSWGGCLETVSGLLEAGREIPHDPSALDGGVLFLETSEELPDDTEVSRILRDLGERGLLARFSALLMGRAKAWSFARPLDPAAKAAYARRQRAAVLGALGTYAPDMTAVFDVDLGHTDPQVVIPYGGVVRVDGPARRITVTY